MRGDRQGLRLVRGEREIKIEDLRKKREKKRPLFLRRRGAREKRMRKRRFVFGRRACGALPDSAQSADPRVDLQRLKG